MRGPDLSLRVNDTSLADALAVMPTRMVALECSQENRPILLKPVGPVEYVSILMPLIAQSSAPAPAPVPSAASSR